MAAIFQIRRGSGSVSLVDGELYLHEQSRSVYVGTDNASSIQLAKLDEVNTGSFNVTGDITLGGTITIGDTTSDSVIFNADLSSSLIPDSGSTYDLGSSTKWYRNLYVNTISASFISGAIDGIGNITDFSASIDNRLDRVEASSSLYDNAMSGSLRLYVSPEGFDTNDGKDPSTPFKTIKAAVESLGAAEFTNTKRYTIFVGSGNYTEQNPITVPPGVAIVGDTLRTVRLTAANPTKDFFHIHDSNYFYGLRFLDLQHPAFAFSFPSSTATSTISGGSISNINVVHSVSGYTDGTNLDLGIIIEGPDAGGDVATATANVEDGVITQINIVDGGTNYTSTEKPHISIPAPVAKRPLITTSPYIQNCSSITGPFNTSGVKILQALPYSETTFNIDEQGAGGGLRIDGNLVHPNSPLESFVADAFTQVNQGGPGHLVINKGYAQFVSCFTTFCTYGFKVANGGFANISNSVIDFGKKGLLSKTYYPETYNTAVANESKYSSVTGFEITQDGAGYTGSIAGVILSTPDIIGGTQATAEAVVSALGTITSVYITNAGTGYTSEPSVTIAAPTGPGAVQATANSIISGVTQMRMVLDNTIQSVEISSNMILDGANYLVTNVQTGSNSSEKLITTYPNPPQIESGNDVYFHKLSNISTGGLVMEYVGSGVTYNALPKYGGVPDRTKEIIEIAPGRVFYSTVDNIGNLKIGEYFAVDQLTGEVTIDARNFNLSGINQIGPFRRNGLSVGKVLREVSDSVTLVNSQGVVGSDTVPTQYAVYEYVNNYTASANSRLDSLQISSASVNLFTASANSRLGNLETTSASHSGRLNNLESKSASVDISLAEIHSYTSSLKDAITVTGVDTNSLTTIRGDFRVLGTSSIITSQHIHLDDNIIELNGTGETFGGFLVKDPTGGSTVSGSLKWNTNLDRWEAGKDEGDVTSISKILLAGGDGVLSGSSDFNSFSTSVDSRLTNLETKSASVDISILNINSTTASLSSSVGNINVATASLYTSSSLMTASISLLTSSVVALQAFSGNVNTRFDNLQTYTTSVDSRFTTLETYTASVNQTTASLNSFTESTNTRLGLLETSTGSLNSFSASVTASLEKLYESTASLNLFSASVTSSLVSIYQTTSSLNSFSASVTASLERMTASIIDHEDRITYVEGINGITGGNPLTQLNLFSASAKISIANLETFSGSTLTRLSNLEITSASINAWSSSLTTTFATDAEVAAGYESQGRGIVSGSSQIVPLLPTGVVSGSSQIITADSITLGTHTTGNYIQTIAGDTTNGLTVAGSGLESADVTLTLAQGIKTTSDVTFNNITASAGIRAVGDIIAYYSSDERLKENIQPIPNALSKIELISGNTYDWKEGFDNIHPHKGNDVGVIAQEVEKVLPQVVINRDNGYKAVDYEKIVPLLIEAIKELSAKVDRLENK